MYIYIYEFLYLCKFGYCDAGSAGLGWFTRPTQAAINNFFSPKASSPGPQAAIAKALLRPSTVDLLSREQLMRCNTTDSEREPAVSPSPVQATAPCSALAIPVQASAPSALAVPVQASAPTSAVTVAVQASAPSALAVPVPSAQLAGCSLQALAVPVQASAASALAVPAQASAPSAPSALAVPVQAAAPSAAVSAPSAPAVPVQASASVPRLSLPRLALP